MTSPLTRTITAITSIADDQLNRYSKLIEDGERLRRERLGDACRFNPARKGCDLCTDPDGTEWLPMYGVAPHECFWRKGPEFTIGQSTLVPFTEADCFVPDLDPDEDWSAFLYPSACGVFYCRNCNTDEYRAAWQRLVDRIGPPPLEIASHSHTEQSA